MRVLVALALLVSGCAAQSAAEAPAASTPALSMAEILEQAPASDWRALDQNNLIYMTLPAGRVVIELAPDFAPNHVRNIRALAHAHYFDGAWVVRSQDNYVVQWSRAEDDPAPMGEGVAALPAEFDRQRGDLPMMRLRDPDSYAPEVGFTNGFPSVANGGTTWLAHCYAMVGAGRGDTADSGSGAELYVVIGQAPRHLDRNVTLVGRVVQGMELLSVMPRGTGDLGFYETPQERTAISAVRLGSDLPAAEQVRLEALRTESASFASLVEARRTRRDGWFLDPVGHINLCNVPLPVRAAAP